MKAILAAVLGLSVLSCPKPPSPTPAPSPTPIPSPTPAPVRLSLLHREGSKFKDATGKVVNLQGYGGVCCVVGSGPDEFPSNGWPWIAESWLKELASYGGNYAHVRLGPPSPRQEPRSEMRPYADLPNGQPDLTRWNPAMWAKLNRLIDYADALGIYIEVDLIDAWDLKDPGNNAWNAKCDILQAAPKPLHQHFLEKVDIEIGHHRNVIYQIGNETFVCGSTLAWELGVVDTMHIQEEKSGHPRHMMGTNGGIGKVDRHGDVDYITTHQDAAAEVNALNKPVTVNEYNPWIGVATFKTRLVQAGKLGSNYFLWLSNASEPDRVASLEAIREWRKTHP